MITCPPPCREVDGIIEYAKSTGVPFKVTSTYRPRAITLSGNPSRHSQKLAVDFAGLVPSWDSQELADIFEAFRPIAGHLNELIYAGPQVQKNIKRGLWVPKYAQSIHHNHVHVAVDSGIYLPDLIAVRIVDTFSDDPVPAKEVNERTDLVPAITVPHPHGRGYVVLQTRDGGVFGYDDAPFFGSLPGNESGPSGDGPAVGLAWTPSGEGYWILNAEGAVFSYGDAQYRGGVNAGVLVEHFGNRIPVGIVVAGDGYKIVGQDISGDQSPFDSYQLPV